MSIVRFNVSRMFADIEPWDVSNSVANLGPRAGELTWGNALRIAEDHAEWLLSPLADALDYTQRWAKETGAWDAEERASWTDEETLALLVQNVASELRELGCDNEEFDVCVRADNPAYEGTVAGAYWVISGQLTTVYGEVCS